MPAEPIIACGCYKECKANVCAEELQFITDYIDTEIRIEITDKFGQKYIQTVTTDGDGFAVFDLTVDDPKPWSEYAGAFLLSIYDPTAEGCEPLPFFRGDYQYNCLSFEFENRNIYIPPAP